MIPTFTPSSLLNRAITMGLSPGQMNRMAARLRDRRKAKDSPLADARADRSPVSAMGGAGKVQGSVGSAVRAAGLGASTIPIASTTAVAKGFKKLFG